MLTAERKIATHEDQIKNLTAIVEAANATILQRVQLHETKTLEVESRIANMETSIPERLFKTEKRQELYVTMLNEITSKIYMS